MHDVDRPRRDQSRHGRRARACEPAAGPVLAGRRVRVALARSRVAADRGLPGRHGHRQRLFPARVALLRSHRASGAVAGCVAASGQRAHRSSPVRTGDARAAAGRADDGVRLSGRLVCAAGHRISSASARGDGARASGGGVAQCQAAVADCRRRRPVRAGLRGIARVRRTAWRTRRGNAGRQRCAAVGSSVAGRAPSA